MRQRVAAVAWVVGLVVGGEARLAGQASLGEVAELARTAWLGHNPQALIGQSGSVVLQIRGADPSAPLDRAQAVELLRRHWRAAVERSLTLRAVHEVESGKGYAELERRYVVSGTSDERRESIFLGFRRMGGTWLLAEVRSVP